MHRFDETDRKVIMISFVNSIQPKRFSELARKLGANLRKIEDSSATDTDRFEVLNDWWECTGSKVIGLLTCYCLLLSELYARVLR